MLPQKINVPSKNFSQMQAGFEKNELLLKMLPKLFFFRILVFFYFWGIRNRELILDRFFGTAVIKVCTEK